MRRPGIPTRSSPWLAKIRHCPGPARCTRQPWEVAMYIKIRLLGYSFHPMLVAYPVTLYTVTLVVFIIYQLQGEVFWFRLGHLASKVGVTMGLVTLVPGLVSWLFGLPRNSPAKASDLWYLLLNAGGLVLFAIAA